MKNPIWLLKALSASIAILFALECCADFRVEKISDSVVDAKALTIDGAFGQTINGLSFQQSAHLSHEGYQYAAYYDADCWVCIARRALPEGEWETIRLTDYKFKSNDAHNVISMGICPGDGTIHLAFDHHGSPLHYRVSRKGAVSEPDNVNWKAELFGPVISELQAGNPTPQVTYPRFWQTPDSGLQFCYRRAGSGKGDRMLIDYDPETGMWTNTRQIDSREGVWKAQGTESNSRCSYPNGYGYGPLDKLHVTWVWREGGGMPNHDLMYAYSEDRGNTWKNDLGETFDGPPRVDSPSVTVVKISHQLGLINTHGQAVDSQGRVHVIMWHCTEESLAAAGSKPGEHRWGPLEARRYHHYWRKSEGEWLHRELPGVVGNRPKIFMDKNDNAYVIYNNLKDGPSDLHGSGDLHIAAATASSQWTDWKIVHLEKGPFLNEMLADTARWRDEGVLSIMAQGFPEQKHQPTPLRILDFSIAVE